jgi:gamma-glutamyl hydrolase
MEYFEIVSKNAFSDSFMEVQYAIIKITHPRTFHISNMTNDVVLFLFFITIFHYFHSANSRSEILLPSQLNRNSLISSPVSCPAPDPNLYYQPVIGILSHPGDGASGRLSNATDASYIAASYVKFVEAAGARVVPLIYTEPWKKLLEVSIAIQS